MRLLSRCTDLGTVCYEDVGRSAGHRTDHAIADASLAEGSRNQSRTIFWDTDTVLNLCPVVLCIK